MRDVRQAQNRNAWPEARLGVQLVAPEMQAPRKRFFGGPIALPATPAAPPTTIAAQRLLLQSAQVAVELALSPLVAGPGAV